MDTMTNNEQRLAFAKTLQESRPENIIHESVKIGFYCAIGEDGFGYAREEDGTLFKMPHTGNVVINENVEIGNNVCIDRAVIGSTVIGSGTKIDNLVHIAHGVKIGKNCLIVAGSVIGGSAEIGDNCFIGINASIKNKVKIGNDVTIGMGAVVTKDVPDGETWIGNPAKNIKDRYNTTVTVSGSDLLFKPRTETR
jgi:UDP-3-O-[3-hydroxymyristoyl] glucosamine N-acyltransferase